MLFGFAAHMHHFDSGPLIGLVILLSVQQVSFAEEPSCPKSSEAKQGAEKTEGVLSGKIQIQDITKEGKHYFRVKLPVSLPHLTRIKVSLYYVRGETPTKHIAYRKTVRVNRKGTVTADLLALKREPWAGCYRLIIRFDPRNQVPTVQKKLNSKGDIVERKKNWYHGTPEKLARQKEKAVERAKRDFHRVLSMAEELRDTVRVHRQKEETLFMMFPYSIPFRFPCDWVIHSMEWRANLEQLKASNRRRPWFDGRTVPYFYIENRTAYFLQYDIRRLEKLFELANRLVWTDMYNQNTVQALRNQHQKIREGIANTMTLLKLIVPLSEDQRKEFRRTLNKLEGLFQTLSTLMSNGEQEDKNEGNTKRIRNIVSRIQASLLQVNTDVPDVVYKKVSSLAKQLQQVRDEIDTLSIEEKNTLSNELQITFRELNNLANSFLEAKFQ